MRVEQAIYGETRGAHSLRDTSGDVGIASSIAELLDLPDTAPAGVDWSPFIRGFPYGNRYVLARTFHDRSATRAGMVLSHAVIAPLLEIVDFADLRPLLVQLSPSTAMPESLASLEIMEGAAPRPPISSDLAPAAAEFVAPGQGPIVRLGHEGFDDLVAALWFNLWPSIRRSFAFRISFSPKDLWQDPLPQLVCTPHALVSRWTGHRVIGVAPRSGSIAALALMGDEASRPLTQFAIDIGAEPATFQKLKLLEDAWRLISSEAATLDGHIAALRLMETLSPNPASGIDLKADLIDRVAARLSEASASSISSMRNLELKAILSIDALWAAVSHRVAANPFKPEEDNEFVEVATYATTNGAATPIWGAAVLSGFHTAARDDKSSLPSALWRWLTLRAEVVKRLLDRLPFDGDVEFRLAAMVPSALPHEAAHAVMAAALTAGRLLLHGAFASAILPSIDALRLQIKVQKDPQSSLGLRQAARFATEPQLIEISLELDDTRVTEMAAEMSAASPSLLRDIDFSSRAAQRLWVTTLAIDRETWSSPRDPKLAFSSVLHGFVTGAPTDFGLIVALSTSPLADVGDFAYRSELWPKLTAETRSRMLAETAKGWLRNSLSGTLPYAPDTDLRAAILALNDREQILGRLANGGILTGVRIVSALPEFGQGAFATWFRTVLRSTRAMSSVEAEAIGHLVFGRHWTTIVDEMVRELEDGRSDLRPALRICQHLLGLLRRYLLGISPLSIDEKWEAFANLASELYASGPDHNELWERAGGRNAELERHGSGQARWWSALRYVRSGGGVTAHDLLKEMQLEYRYDEGLRYLSQDRDITRR